jgi:hypothetical protein
MSTPTVPDTAKAVVVKPGKYDLHDEFTVRLAPVREGDRDDFDVWDAEGAYLGRVHAAVTRSQTKHGRLSSYGKPTRTWSYSRPGDTSLNYWMRLTRAGALRQLAGEF